MWEADYKESWVTKNWCFWTVVLEKTLESSLDKEITLVHPKWNQPWIFIGRTDVEAKTPILWPPDVKNWLTGKDRDAGKDRGQEEKWTTEDEMVRWHHRFDGHECEQAPGDDEGQGSLACCSPWGCKSRTQLSNWTCKQPTHSISWACPAAQHDKRQNDLSPISLSWSLKPPRLDSHFFWVTKRCSRSLQLLYKICS